MGHEKVWGGGEFRRDYYGPVPVRQDSSNQFLQWSDRTSPKRDHTREAATLSFRLLVRQKGTQVESQRKGVDTGRWSL